MNWKDKLMPRNTAPAVSFDNDYIEKLAAACDYAANSLGATPDITRNIANITEQVYVQKQEITGTSDFLLGKLKEKIARRQETFVANDQAQSAQVVQNILSRLREKQEVEEVVEQAPTETVQAVEDIVALPHTSLTDVLEAVKANTHIAGEASTSQETPVKTAGARGKGPEAIGAAANRLRDKLLAVGDRRGN